MVITHRPPAPASPTYEVEVSDILSIHEMRLMGRDTPACTRQLVRTYAPEEVKDAVEGLSLEDRRLLEFLAAQEAYTAVIEHFEASGERKEVWTYEVRVNGAWFTSSGGTSLLEVLERILKDFLIHCIARAGEADRALPTFKGLLPSEGAEG